MYPGQYLMSNGSCVTGVFELRQQPFMPIDGRRVTLPSFCYGLLKKTSESLYYARSSWVYDSAWPSSELVYLWDVITLTQTFVTYVLHSNRPIATSHRCGGYYVWIFFLHSGALWSVNPVALAQIDKKLRGGDFRRFTLLVIMFLSDKARVWNRVIRADCFVWSPFVRWEKTD